jgi:hypothetical protein
MNKKSKYKIGDVIKERNRFFDGYPKGSFLPTYWTVYGFSQSGGGYNLYRSDKNGNPVFLNENTNVMYLRLDEEKHIRKFGHISLEAVTVKIENEELTFTRTKHKMMNIRIAHHDGRVSLFFKVAPKSMQRKFDRWENDNYHFACAEMVADFIDHPKKYNPELKVGKRKISKLP